MMCPIRIPHHAGSQIRIADLALLCRVESQEMMTTTEEEFSNIPWQSAPALRLLYACLSPLEHRKQGQAESYMKFVKEFPFDLSKESLTVADVLTFLRRALGIPDDKYMMLLLLVDEGNAAQAAFPRGKGDHPAQVRNSACLSLQW